MSARAVCPLSKQGHRADGAGMLARPGDIVLNEELGVF
jgi:hypothetical protein